MPRLCDTARMKCRSGLPAVISVESARHYRRGNVGGGSGNAEVGLLESRHPLSLWPPYAAAWLVPAQSIYMLSATSQSRLNIFIFYFFASGNDVELFSRFVWLPNSQETQTMCFFYI